MIERILKLMEQNDIKDVEIVRELGLSNGVFTQWKNGKAKPGTDAVIKIAEYFNVSCDYLLTGKTATGEEYSQDELNIIKNYRQLNDEGQEKVTEYIKLLADSGQYIKSREAKMDKKQAQ